MVTIVSALVVLGVLIFVHELGHFLVAKWAGVRVTVFSLGFGPRLLGYKKGDTDYRLSVFPLGGYVRMTGEGVDEDVAPEDIPYSFFHKRLRVRFAIVAAGPLANILFALLVYFCVLYFAGLPNLVAKAGEVPADQPAAMAGLQSGDEIVAANGQPVEYWSDLVKAVRLSKGQPLELTVVRGNRQHNFVVQPAKVTVKDIFGDEHDIFRIGLVADGQIVSTPVGLGEAMSLAFQETYWAGEIIIVSVAKIIQQKVSADNLGGPILIAQVAGEAATQGLAALLKLSAMLSVNLAILNLLPIPALDGGHLFFYAIEGVTRRPVASKVREWAQQIGILLLIGLMVFVFYNDIVRLLS